MKRWMTASATAGILALGIAAVRASQDPVERARAADIAEPVVAVTVAQEAPEKKLSADEKAKLEKELKELEEQRAKTDEKIRDVRKKLGKPQAFTFVGPGAFAFSHGEALSPEKQKEVQAAIEKAHKAMADAMKDLPARVVIPDVKALTDRALRFHMAPDGVFRTYRGMSAEERAKLEKNMAQMREELRRIRPEVRAFTFDGERMRSLTPEVRKEMDAAREELERARKELEKAREEMRKEREKRPI